MKTNQIKAAHQFINYLMGSEHKSLLPSIETFGNPEQYTEDTADKLSSYIANLQIDLMGNRDSNEKPYWNNPELSDLDNQLEKHYFNLTT